MNIELSDREAFTLLTLVRAAIRADIGGELVTTEHAYGLDTKLREAGSPEPSEHTLETVLGVWRATLNR